jgi:formylglycine-generating enzyme required for sulfatase activity
MRTRVALPLAASLAAFTLVEAGAAPPPPLPSPPADEGSAAEGIAVIRTPGPDAILIRSGTFMMGSNELEIAHALAICQLEPARDECALAEEMFAAEYAPHEVWLSDFWIDRTEVTVARFRQCVAAGRCAAPPYAAGGERFDGPDLPVTLVTWNDARTFCAWAGGRLPTEAEWERAARGTALRRYPWGNVWNPNLANHGRFGWDYIDGSDGYLELAPVGSFRDGRTPDGIDDLAGNVEEWAADWYAHEYPRQSSVNPRGPDAGEQRVIRGGSYGDARPWLRGSARDKDWPGMRRANRGFRCVRDP